MPRPTKKQSEALLKARRDLAKLRVKAAAEPTHENLTAAFALDAAVKLAEARLGRTNRTRDRKRRPDGT
jgi:hypothetical protein